MMMICRHRMGDNGNGPDPVIEHIFTHKRHTRHGYHQFYQWLSKCLLLNLMRILVAWEDNEGLDRVSEHLHMHLHLMRGVTTVEPHSRVSDR